MDNTLTLRLYCVSDQLSQKFKLLVARSQTYIKTIYISIFFNIYILILAFQKKNQNNNNQTCFQPGAVNYMNQMSL
jgi:hypothetical protein